MRCLSPHGNYSIQVIEGEEQVIVDARGAAKSLVLRKPTIANFERQGLLDHEIEAALERFNFSGLAEGVNPLTTIAVFDSEAYVDGFGLPKEKRDELLALIDERLIELQAKHPGEFIIVDFPEAAKPWPTYDTDSVEEIIAFQERLGISPETVRLYELENENRPEVIEAMLRQEDPELADAQFGPVKEEAIEVSA